MAKGNEGPEVERRRPVERRNIEEGDELNELQEVRNVSHNLRWISGLSASATQVHPPLWPNPEAVIERKR